MFTDSRQAGGQRTVNVSVWLILILCSHNISFVSKFGIRLLLLFVLIFYCIVYVRIVNIFLRD